MLQVILSLRSVQPDITYSNLEQRLRRPLRQAFREQGLSRAAGAWTLLVLTMGILRKLELDLLWNRSIRLSPLSETISLNRLSRGRPIAALWFSTMLMMSLYSFGVMSSSRTNSCPSLEFL